MLETVTDLFSFTVAFFEFTESFVSATVPPTLSLNRTSPSVACAERLPSEEALKLSIVLENVMSPPEEIRERSLEIATAPVKLWLPLEDTVCVAVPEPEEFVFSK